MVYEQDLGHRTIYLNHAQALEATGKYDLSRLPIEHDVHGWKSKIPLYGSNFSIRGSLRAKEAIHQAQRDESIDVMVLHTQVLAALNRSLVCKVPTIISIDATPGSLDAMGCYGTRKLPLPFLESIVAATHHVRHALCQGGGDAIALGGSRSGEVLRSSRRPRDACARAD